MLPEKCPARCSRGVQVLIIVVSRMSRSFPKIRKFRSVARARWKFTPCRTRHGSVVLVCGGLRRRSSCDQHATAKSARCGRRRVGTGRRRGIVERQSSRAPCSFPGGRPILIPRRVREPPSICVIESTAAPEHIVKMAVHCAETRCGSASGASLDVTKVFTSAPVGVWQSFSLPLSCWSAAGARLQDVDAPFSVTTAGRFGLTLSDVRIGPKSDRAALPCP